MGLTEDSYVPLGLTVPLQPVQGVLPLMNVF